MHYKLFTFSSCFSFLTPCPLPALLLIYSSGCYSISSQNSENTIKPYMHDNVIPMCNILQFYALHISIAIFLVVSFRFSSDNKWIIVVKCCYSLVYLSYRFNVFDIVLLALQMVFSRYISEATFQRTIQPTNDFLIHTFCNTHNTMPIIIAYLLLATYTEQIENSSRIHNAHTFRRFDWYLFKM